MSNDELYIHNVYVDYIVECENLVPCRLVSALKSFFKLSKLRGYSYALSILKRLFDGSSAIALYGEDAKISFDIFDSYWGFYILGREPYEPEIFGVLNILKDLDYVFLDIGANIGYWSLLVSSSILGNKQAAGIEASYSTYTVLEKNMRNNGGRFKVFHNAIDSKDNRMLQLSTGPHAARRILDSGCVVTPSKVESVESITINTLLHKIDASKQEKLVVKLDVEGNEISALKGFDCVCDAELLIIYEDHGRDRTHSVTRYIMEALGLDVWYVKKIDNGAYSLNEISDPSYLDTVKINEKLGYNFFACKKGGCFESYLNNSPPFRVIVNSEIIKRNA